MAAGVGMMNPYAEERTFDYVRRFYSKFYNDPMPRTSVWGINPGRHGGGLTGIAFTDPFALSQYCGIPNDLAGAREQSSRFIYTFIEHFGGPEKFYRQFYITSLCPLGLVKDGRNYNFYDDPQTRNALRPFIVESIFKQQKFGLNRSLAICLGTGTLHTVFAQLNDEHGFFDRIVPVEHPRFIMQYRAKRISEYVAKYGEVFSGEK